MRLEIRYEREKFLKEIFQIDALEKNKTINLAGDITANISEKDSQLSTDAISLIELSLAFGTGLSANLIYSFLERLWIKGGKDIVLVSFRSYKGIIKLFPSQSQSELIKILQPLIDSLHQLKVEGQEMIDRLKELEDNLEDKNLSADQLDVINSTLTKGSYSHILDLLANDELEEALSDLLSGAPTQVIENQLIIQMALLARINQRYNQVLISTEDFNVNKNRIIWNVLKLREEYNF